MTLFRRGQAQVWAGVCAGWLGLGAFAASAALVHRWSFDETGGAGTTLLDSVGTAHATIVEGGTNNADVGQTLAGQVYLAGGPQAVADYVRLPPGILSACTADATIELWATPQSVRTWSRLFDFGLGTTEFVTMTWTSALDPNTEQVRWIDATMLRGDNDNYISNSMQPYALSNQVHVVLVMDVEGSGPGLKTVLRWYKDGVYRGSVDTYNRPVDLTDSDNTLGRSKTATDNTAHAAYNELRIYNHALRTEEIVRNFAAGPDAPPPSATGATGLGRTAATLSGALPVTNGPTHVWACWGPQNGGANLAAAVPNALSYGYFPWATVEHLSALDDGVANGRNGGLFALTPSVVSNWVGEVWQAANKADYYTQMWWGCFTPPTNGVYTFVVGGDDHETMWVDLDRDGEFELAAGERVTANLPPEGWNTPKTANVTLTAGLPYLLAWAHNEAGGGDFFNLTIATPGGTAQRVNPGLPAQAGWWSAPGWAHATYLGAFPVGALAASLTTLAPTNSYAYRFYASNTVWQTWSGVETFATVSDSTWTRGVDSLWGVAGNWSDGNVPDAAGERAAFTGVGPGIVDLNGTSFRVGELAFSAGSYRLADTRAAPGTLTADLLTHTAGSNTVAVGLAVTGTATVAGGALTLANANALTAGALRLAGGTVTAQGSFAAGANQLAIRGFHFMDDTLHNFEGNGGLLARAPTGTAVLTTGPGNRGLDFGADADFTGTGAVTMADYFMTLFLGAFTARESGAHVFRVSRDDDISNMWLDRDQDGVFERAGALGDERLAYEDLTAKTVMLTAGQSYRFAVSHRDAAGPSSLTVYFKTPSMAAEAIVKPGDATQAGYWSSTSYGALDLRDTPVQVTGNSRLVLASDTGAALGSLAVNAGATLTLLAGIPGVATVASAPINGNLNLNIGSLRLNGFTSAGGNTFTIPLNTALTTDAPLTAGTVSWVGALSVSGAITTSTKLSIEPPRTVSNVLAGAGEVWLGENRTANSFVMLVATNTYTNSTVIRRALLRATDGVGLPAAAPLRFSSQADDEYAMFEGKGTIVRDIGTGPGQVYWDNRGGFSGLGGPLTVTLEGGSGLTWTNAMMGLNNKYLQLGSPFADSAATLVNNLDITTADAYVMVWDNAASSNDVGVLAGDITGSNNAVWFRKYRNGTLWLKGANTYAQRTLLDDGILRLDSQANLSPNSMLAFDQDNWGTAPAVIECKGALARDIGLETEPGTLSWARAVGNGGFAAFGGPLTVTLEGGATLDWGSTTAGFGGHVPQFGSRTANHRVELTNPVDLNSRERFIVTFDNATYTNDVALWSGIISGSGVNSNFWIRGDGLVWFTGANTYVHRTVIDDGATLRAADGVGLSPASTLVFDTPATTVLGSIFESSGTFARNCGPATEAGAVSWQWQSGGFAAWNGRLAVNLEGGARLDSGSIDLGFAAHDLQFGSKTANAVVDFQNDVWISNRVFAVRLFDNAFATTDHAVMSGDITMYGAGDMQVRGNGLLKLSGNNTLRQLRVYDTARLLLNGTQECQDYLFTEANMAATLGGTGRVHVINYVDIRALGTLAPGDEGVGTLRLAVDGLDLEMLAGSTYAWEFGGLANDRVDVTGNLRLTAGWKLKLLDGGGMPAASEAYTLFTYTGSMADYAAPVLDLTAAPAHWVTNGVTVVHDAVGKRVYVTGLGSTLGLDNRPATGLTATAAQLNGLLSCSGQTVHVWAYWGGVDGGTNPGGWSNKVDVGVFANVQGQALTATLGGLAANRAYWFTFRATNATADIWAQPAASFLTLGPPQVANAGATAVAAGSATLQGAFLDHNRGAVTICWGTADGGAVSTSQWQHAVGLGTQTAASFAATVNQVYYPQTYYYRCYAENAYGADWSDTAGAFTVTSKPEWRYPVAGLKGRWTFDDGTCRDTSGNGYDGDLVGGFYASDTPAALAGGQSINLSTGDHFVKVDTGDGQAAFNLDTLSVACWVKGWPDGNWEPYVSKQGETAGWQLRKNAATAASLSWTLLGPGNDNWLVTTNINNGAWHHLVATYGGGYRRLYVDNVMVGQELRAGLIADTTDMLAFGADHVAGTFVDFARVRLDDVLIYDRPLTAAEVSQLYSNAVVSTATLVNRAATAVTLNTATLNAALSAPNAVYTVRAFWGETDRGANPGLWTSQAVVGTYTGRVGTVSHPIGSLAPGRTYWYTFQASNALDQVWATPSTNVMPVAAPAVDNLPGALVSQGAASLQGNLTAGNSADVYVYWGRADGGTDKTAWEWVAPLGERQQGAFSTNVAAGYGASYHYRCYATNAAGQAWAAASAGFATPQPPDSAYIYAPGLRGSVFLATPDTEAPVNLDGGAFTNSLTRVFTGGKTNCILYLTADPARNVVASGLIQDFNQFPGFAPPDHFVAAFSGRLFPRKTGLHFFRWNDDDRGLMYIDRNANHVFETTERVAPYAWASTGALALTNGVGGYDFIFMTQEIGGVQTLMWYVTEPDSAEAQVNTVTQAPMWQYPARLEARPTLATTGASGLTTNAVVVNGDLRAAGWTFDLYACWGAADGGQALGNWQHVTNVGTFVNQDGAVSNLLTGLAQGTTYWYTLLATNAVTNLWGDSVAFMALGAPVVENGPPTAIAARSATLEARLTRGGEADVTVFWGLADGGTDLRAWANTNALGHMFSASATTAVSVWGGGQYYFRSYATNALGADWADATGTFTTPEARQYYRPGLLGCHTNGNMYLGAVNAGNLGIVRGPYGGRTAAEHWNQVIAPETSTLLYTGQIYLSGGPCTFVESIDDRTRLLIDGVQVFDNVTWNDTVHGTLTRAAGWYNFDLRFSNGTGGYGPVQQDGWTGAFGFGMDSQGRDTEYPPHFVFPEDPGNRTLFRYLDTTWAGILADATLANGTVSDHAPTAATLNGSLTGTGWVFKVYALCGTNDAGKVFNAWPNRTLVGFYTNHSGALSHSITGLTSGVNYWCTYFATNAVTNIWPAARVRFQTVAAPVVVNLAASGVTSRSATLNGQLTTGGAAAATLYWGLADGGPVRTAWQFTNTVGTVPVGTFAATVSPLAGGRYYQRAYVTNAVGADWADTAAAFNTPQATLDVADAGVVEGNTGMQVLSFTVALSAACVSNVTVQFATTDGSALAGVDYVATNGTLVIPAGQPGGMIAVLVNGDTVREAPGEFFSLTLSGVANAVLGDATAAGDIEDDDGAGLDAWKCRMQITFSGYEGATTLTNFPALVVFKKDMPDFRYSQFTSQNGWDLRFTDATGMQVLSYDIEQWNTNGDSYVWVRVPALAGRNTSIWAYWNNPSLAGTAGLPPTAVPGCVLWLDGDDLDGDGRAEGVAESGQLGGVVRSWRDKSGRRLAAAPASTPPAFVASGAPAGHAAVRFDGLDDFLDYPAVGAQTVFFVCLVEPTLGGNQDGLLGFYNADDGIRRNGDVGWNHPGDANDFSNPAGSTFRVNGVATASAAENVWHIGEACRSGAVMNVNRMGLYYARRPFAGDVAEVIIYDRLLTADELNGVGAYLARKYGLATSYPAPRAVAPPPYALDGSTWSAGYDAVWHFAGGVRDATRLNLSAALGAPAYAAAPAAVVGPALSLDGLDDCVDVGDGFAAYTNGITVSSWVRPTAAGNFARVLDFGNGPDVDNILIARVGVTDQIAWDFRDTVAGNEDYRPAVTPFVLNTWTYLVGTCTKGAVNTAVKSVYINGVSAASQATDTPPPVVTRTINYIGRSNWAGDAYYAGQMDELRISHVARSADWVKAEYLNMSANGAFNGYGKVSAPAGMVLILR